MFSLLPQVQDYEFMHDLLDMKKILSCNSHYAPERYNQQILTRGVFQIVISSDKIEKYNNALKQIAAALV